MRRFGATTLALVAASILAIYAAAGPFQVRHWPATASDQPAYETPGQPPSTSPDSEQLPTLAPPQPACEPASVLALVDLPDGPPAQTQVIFIPVEVERVAVGPRPGGDR